MKKVFFSVIVLAVLCGNSAAKDPKHSLDSAISKMANTIVASQKLGKGKKIVLMDFVDADSVETQNYIEEELTNKLVKDFIVIDRKNLGILRKELEFQRSGEVDDGEIRRIGSVSGSDIVLRGTLKNGTLEVMAHNVQEGKRVHRISLRIKKNDNVLSRLEKNSPSGFLESMSTLLPPRLTPRLLDRNGGVQVAVSHLTEKILEKSKSDTTNILIYDIMADNKDLSESVFSLIDPILTNDPRVNNLDRDNLPLIAKEVTFQASGEVDLNTAKERGRLLGAQAVIYGNIRPLGSNYRLFLCAVDVESGIFIATHSQLIQGNRKEIKAIAAPSKVRGVDATAISSDRVRISWNNALDARTFIVTRSAENSDTVERRFYTGASVAVDFDLKPETEYCYTVQPRNTVGLGETTEPICVKTHGEPVVSDEKVTVKAKTEKSVTLLWDNVSGASHYNIQRCRGQDQECATIEKNVRDNFYKDTSNLQSSTYYTYYIDVENSAGTDKLPGKVVITMPRPPKNLRVAETFANKVKLTWEDAQENISYYIVDVSPKGGDAYQRQLAGGMALGLNQETEYSFKVQAVNTGNDRSDFSESVAATTSGRPDAPISIDIRIDSSHHSNLGKPGAMSPRKSSSYDDDDDDDDDDGYSLDFSKKVVITWRPVPGAEDYVVYKNDVVVPKMDEGTLYQENYSNLKKGTEYRYAIASKNEAGTSEPTYAPRPILTEPPRPTIIDQDEQNNWAVIEWKSVPRAHRYYVKHISTSTDRVRRVDTLTRPISGTSYKWENLPYSSTITYCVIAEDDAGRRSACSKDREIKTSIVPPEITKTVGYGADSVRISWRGSDGATYYNIKRGEERESREIGSTKPASSYNNYYYSTSGSSAPKTEWVDKDIEPKKQYYYYVAAVDKNGNESMSKAYSHKTSAVGTLVLKNESRVDGDIITGYKIKSGSEAIAEGNPNIGSGQEASISIPITVGSKNYEIQITSSSSRKTISGNKTFKITENKEITFEYRGETLRLWE